MKNLLARSAVAIGASMALAATVSATTLEKSDFKDLVQDSAACVVADTQSIDHVMVNGSPVTRTTFAVTKTAFGSTPDTIVVTTPGGKMANTLVPMAEVNAGVPRFFNGSGSVLLLEHGAGGDYVVAGFTQGVFDLFETDLGTMVRLPAEQGGVTPLNEAIDVINAARSADNRQVEE